jgi:hypothetical protein
MTEQNQNEQNQNQNPELADDTEGHVMRHRSADTDDLESLNGLEDDTKGHFRREAAEIDDDDTEGHGFHHG